MFDNDISELIGKTLINIEVSADRDELLFYCKDGSKYKMYHWQDCCESVTIDEIIGDLDDLIGIPILKAEKTSNSDMKAKEEYDESWTWTFYHIASIKGTVTLRWYGESNGYYSEEVDFTKIK